MAYITQHEATFPVVHVQIQGAVTAADLKKWLPAFLALCHRKTPYASILDLSETDLPSLDLAAIIDRQMAPYRDALHQYQVCTCLVFTSAAVRLAANAIILAVRPPSPTRAFASRAEAESFCLERLSASVAKRA